MPPKKKCTHKARKGELIFLERPREGPVHCYETTLPLAENPKRVPTKPVDQNTSAAWVGTDYPFSTNRCCKDRRFLHNSHHLGELCLSIIAARHSALHKAGSGSMVCPQFEATKSVVLTACQKEHCGPHKPQNQDTNHSLLHAGGACQRAIACKFPPLTFETPEGYALHPSDCSNRVKKNTQRSHSQTKRGTAAKANIQANSPENCRETLLLPAPQPVEPEFSSPPGVETPLVPFVRNWRCSSTLLPSSHCARHPEKELAFGIDPCGSRESGAVLVTDTPEHEYGIRVTWRQRPHLMKYLRERGKLSAADILVKTSPKLSRRQADI